MKKITREDIKEILAITTDLKAFDALDDLNLTYRDIEGGEEYDREILNCIKRIQSDTQIVGTPERTEIWENGWNENLVSFSKNLDIEELKPLYFHSGLPIRYKKHFIKSDNPKFQVDLDLFIKRCLFEQYASSHQYIYEFGCGTGYNLVMLAKIFPKKELFGMDFTSSAIEILSLLKHRLSYNINGYKFDFCKPDYKLKIKPNSAVFTFAALEQIGNRHKDFIKYLIDNNPDVVIHMEPIVELYDDENLLDYLSKCFHEKRQYLCGLLPYLRKLALDEKLQIDKVKRLNLGNHNHEAYTLIVWHPLKENMDANRCKSRSTYEKGKISV